MAIIKCKMCGGDLNLVAGQAIAECEYCGSRQTVPSADNEKKLTLFSRANRLRIACEFDKAAGVYESMVADFPEEAEAYWGLVLCKYGIEYVDDPVTGKKIPTCHRSSFDSVMEDRDFEQTLENAGAESRKVYREEAKRIEEIRKGIIEVSATADPYDIFICYKEADTDGNRTLDSVLAQDVYDALTEKGYRVFFSRITLEDKLGHEYEPYIFAALHSAKVMLAIGTDYEYYNAVWVKNEWSRYLKMMEKDKSKHLIPCFKGIDAYDMPKEFSKLQAQDLGKVGAMQDLLRGIGKIIDTGTVAAAQTVGTTTVIVDTMLKRASDAIAVKDWETAVRCCNNVLDYDDKNEPAYICRILINYRASSLSELENGYRSIASDPNYQYLMHHGSKATVEKMQALEQRIVNAIQERKNQAAKLKKQKRAKKIKIFAAIAAVIVVAVTGLWVTQNVLIPGNTYSKAKNMAKKGQYDEAIAVFASLGDFKDSNNRIYDAYLLKAESFATDGNYLAALEVLESSGVLEMGYGDSREQKQQYIYLMAMSYYESGDYYNAVATFEQVQGYAEADQHLMQCRLNLAEISYENGDYDTAIQQFRDLGEMQRALEITYEVAQLYYESGDYDQAIAAFKNLGDYQNGSLRALEIAYEVAVANYENGDYDAAIAYFTAAEAFEDAQAKVLDVTYEAGARALENKQYTKAIDYFKRAAGHSDADDQLLKAKYQYCSATKDNPDQNTKSYIRELNDLKYTGAAKLYKQIFAWKAEISLKVAFKMGSNTGVNVYAKLSGGDGGSTKVKFVTQVSGQTLTFCDDELYKAGSEASSCVSNYMRDITGLTYTVKVYDGNGNLIGTFKGVPEQI